MTCEICRGAGYVRLPRYKQVSIRYEDASISSEPVEKRWLEIGCPECKRGEETDNAHVSILGAECYFDTRYDDAEKIRDHMKQNIADTMAHELLRSGFISFSEEKARNRYPEVMVMRGKLGVVSTDAVKTIEQRATDMIRDFLGDVASSAAAAIYHWGSFYGQKGITKDMAVQLMQEAFGKHLNKVAK